MQTLNLLYISILNKKLGGINVSCRYLDNCHRNSRSPSKPEEVMTQWYLPIQALNTIIFIFIFDNFRIGRYHLHNRIKSLNLQYPNSTGKRHKSLLSYSASFIISILCFNYFTLFRNKTEAQNSIHTSKNYPRRYLKMDKNTPYVLRKEINQAYGITIYTYIQTRRML